MNYFITTESRIGSRVRKRKMKYMQSGAPQGCRLGEKCLEVVEAADVVLHVAGY
jgi:hypothetical protein